MFSLTKFGCTFSPIEHCDRKPSMLSCHRKWLFWSQLSPKMGLTKYLSVCMLSLCVLESNVEFERKGIVSNPIYFERYPSPTIWTILMIVYQKWLRGNILLQKGEYTLAPVRVYFYLKNPFVWIFIVHYSKLRWVFAVGPLISE